MGLGINDGAIGLQDRAANVVAILPAKRCREQAFRFLDVDLLTDLHPFARWIGLKYSILRETEPKKREGRRIGDAEADIFDLARETVNPKRPCSHSGTSSNAADHHLQEASAIHAEHFTPELRR